MDAASELPIDVFSWGTVTVAMLVLGLRSVSNYRKTGSQLARFYIWVGLAMAAAGALFAFPPIWIRSGQQLEPYYSVGDKIIYLVEYSHLYLVWFLFFKKKWQLVLLMSVGLLILVPLAVITTLDYTIDYQGAVITLHLPAITRYLELFLNLSFLPIGGYFLKTSMSESTTAGRLRFLAFGLLYVGVYIMLAGDYLILESGGQAAVTQVLRLGLFGGFALLFFVLVFWLRKKQPAN